MGKSTPIKPPTSTGNHQNTYQHSLSLFDTSTMGDDANARMTTPLPAMRITVKPDRPIIRRLCHAQGRKSRPSAVKIIKEGVAFNAQRSAQTWKTKSGESRPTPLHLHYGIVR